MKVKMIILLAFVLVVSLNQATAQNCNLEGTVIDKTSHEPIPYANIALFNIADSSLVSGAITDDAGHYQMEHIKTGKYRLKISFIGYQSLIINDLLLQPGTRNLGETSLEVLAENLDEVTIKGSKPAMIYKVDRKVIDAGSFPGADVAIDLLENIPSVQLDFEGNLTYRGDGTFKVYINGHPVQNGEEKLRQLPASRIDKIEIITNPSAKYDAEGTAGIIQVILKKSRLEGYAINANVKADTKGGYQGYFSIDNKKEKSGWYVNGNYGKTIWEKSNKHQVQTISSGNQEFQTISDMQSNHGQTQSNIELGFNYDLTDKDYIDFAGYVNPAKTRQKNTEEGQISEHTRFNDGSSFDTLYHMKSRYEVNYQYVGATLTYEHAFDKTRSHLLSGYIDYSAYLTNLDERQMDTKLYESYTERAGYLGSEHNEIIVEGKMNYKLPLSKTYTLETGAEINTDHIPKVTSISGNFDDEGHIVPFGSEPLNQSVDFIQDVYSGYGTIKREGDKFSVQAGLRTEFTNRRSDYSYDTAENTRLTIPERSRFTDFFPSAHVTYNFSETHQVYASYSRRVQRPDYWKLVPMEQYQTPYSVYRGNGELKPAYTDAYETGYKKSWDKDFVSCELFYRNTQNVMQNFSRRESEKMLVASPENVGSSQSFGAEFMGGVSVFPWWNVNISTSIYSYRLKVSFDEVQETKKQFKTDTRINNTVILPASFTLKWDLSYYSPMISAQTKRDEYFVSNLALKKEFDDGKWIATLVYNDVFSSRKYDTTTLGEGFITNGTYDGEPYLSVKFAYVFDNQN